MWKVYLATGLNMLLLLSSAAAQLPTVADSRLGVDRVRLTSGESLYGFILQIEPNQSLTLAVERSWLASTYPQLSQRMTVAEKEMSAAAKQQLLERILAWLDEVGQKPGVLTGLLQSELARLQIPSEQRTTLFVRIELPLADVREKTLQPAQRRQIAGLAWQHGLANPTTTPVTTLARQLHELGVDVAKEKVDLADQIVSGPLTDKQWATRQALIEYRVEDAVEYQGTGSTFVRKNGAADTTSLLTQMLSGAGSDEGMLKQLGAELGLPEFGQLAARDDWSAKVTQVVEREGHRAVRITRLTQSLLSPLVQIETCFLAMEKPGAWFEVAKFTAEVDANTVPVERCELIKSDPQVKQLLETLAALGLPIDQARIDQAIRHGAAAQEAVLKADTQFQEFLALTKDKLDAPFLK